jgi:osmotically-inducible protein OsmY
MKCARKITSLFLGATSLFLSGSTIASSVRQEPAPDNTKTNKRDRDKTAPTADQQQMNAEDRAITKKIRAAIHDDKSLSTYAHNVKIIAQNGKVTLKGPVRSDEEKSSIEAKATEIAGKGNVTNELEVAPPKAGR